MAGITSGDQNRDFVVPRDVIDVVHHPIPGLSAAGCVRVFIGRCGVLAAGSALPGQAFGPCFFDGNRPVKGHGADRLTALNHDLSG